MSKVYKLILILLSTIIMTGCVSEPKVKIEEKVYTQVGMWYLNKSREVFISGDVLSDGDSITAIGSIPAVNYSRDVFIPVNTLVTIVDNSTYDTITFKLQNKIIALVNKKAYTGLSTADFVKKMFTPTPVDLSGFTESEQKFIAKGEVELYMSKEAVIVSRGYPPIHRTPNLEDNTWRYWEARFNSRNYIFDDNKLIRLQD